ncbi:MAG TPA: hypothetical protein PLQ11_03575 [Beijerinckiaceae bacterium]|nr:hypothetical protein [Beijerinckiaceae bacterium]
MTTTRRALLGATAAFAAVPAAFAAPSALSSMTAPSAAAAGASEIRHLWDEVIDLSIRLGGHPTPLVAQETGLPGWMYVSGEANELGNARYDRLVKILHATPRSNEDLAIIARAANHCDIQTGPRTYAAARLADAAMTMAA